MFYQVVKVDPLVETSEMQRSAIKTVLGLPHIAALAGAQGRHYRYFVSSRAEVIHFL